MFIELHVGRTATARPLRYPRHFRRRHLAAVLVDQIGRAGSPRRPCSSSVEAVRARASVAVRRIRPQYPNHATDEPDNRRFHWLTAGCWPSIRPSGKTAQKTPPSWRGCVIKARCTRRPCRPCRPAIRAPRSSRSWRQSTDAMMAGLPQSTRIGSAPKERTPVSIPLEFDCCYTADLTKFASSTHLRGQSSDRVPAARSGCSPQPQLRHGRLKTFAAQKHCSFLR